MQKTSVRMAKKRTQHQPRHAPPEKAVTPGWKTSIPAMAGIALLIAGGMLTLTSLKIFYSGVKTFQAQMLINTRRAPEVEGAAIGSVRLDPDNGYAHYFLGAFYHRQGRLNLAEEQLYKSLRTIAHPATPLLLLAEIQLLKGDYEKALFFFDRTFKMNPTPRVSPGTRWYSLGKTAANARNYAMGVASFQESQDYGHDARDIHQSLGSQYYRLGLPVMATYEFQRQIQRVPAVPSIFSDLATVLMARQEYKEGIRFFEKSLGKDPDNQEIIRYLVVFLIKDGQHEQATAYLKRQLEKRPEDQTFLFLLGMAYMEHGDSDEAITSLRRFLDTNPPESSARQAEKMLERLVKGE